MKTKKNYYVCLRFKDRPELHMTVKYLKNLTPENLAGVVSILDTFMYRKDVEAFTPVFDLVGWYGPSHTVRVLQARTRALGRQWPSWVENLREILPDTGQDYTYHPHVSSKEDTRIEAKVIAVSLMCKKVEITRWDLD